MIEDNLAEGAGQATLTNLFVYGPLRDEDVRRILLGPKTAPSDTAFCTLSGYRVESVFAQFHPVLNIDRDSVVEGLLLSGLSSAAMQKLRYFAEHFGCDLGAVTVRTTNGEEGAACFLPKGAKSPTDGLWNFGSWQMKQKRPFLDMCAEIMQKFGDPVSDSFASFMKGVSGRVLAREDARTQEPVCMLRAGLGRGDVRSDDPDLPYHGFFAIQEHRLSHRQFDGTWSPELERAVFVSADAAVVLPYDPVRDSVLLVEQFRPGPYARGDAKPWCLEVVAGRRDQNEAFEDTARREALEEAGLRLGRLEQIGKYYSSPGAVAEYLSAYIGEADLTGGGGFHGLQTENEDIRAIVVGRGEAMSAVASGEINNAHTILPLLYLELHHERLRARWSVPDLAAG